MSRQPGSVRAEAERRGVSPARVQRERARQQPEIEPRLAQQCHYLSRVLGLSPSTVAAQLGLTEATVIRALADVAPALASYPDPKIRPESSMIPSVVSGSMPSVRLS